jgi:hypothetical protein
MVGNGLGGVLSQKLLFADAKALSGGTVNTARVDLVAGALRRAAQQSAVVIDIELATGERLAGLHASWQDLCARADATNIFMNPVLLALAAQAYPERRCCAVLAWQKDGTTASRLLGIWGFAIGRAPFSSIPSSMLCAPYEECLPVDASDRPEFTRRSACSHDRIYCEQQ